MSQRKRFVILVEFRRTCEPYLNRYHCNGRFLYKQNCFRKEYDGRYIIGDSPLSVDDTSDISIKGKHFKCTRGLWQLLKRKNVNRGDVTTDDLKLYKTILQLTNAHLQGYEPGGNVHTPHGPKFRDVDSKIFLRQECLAELTFFTATLGEGLTWLENNTLISKVPGSSRPRSGCMLQRWERRRGTESMARGRGCLQFTSPRSKEISAQSLHRE